MKKLTVILSLSLLCLLGTNCGNKEAISPQTNAKKISTTIDKTNPTIENSRLNIIIVCCWIGGRKKGCVGGKGLCHCKIGRCPKNFNVIPGIPPGLPNLV